MNDLSVIFLANGKGFAVVESEVFPTVKDFNWYRDTNGYAARGNWFDGKSHKVYLHRQITSAPDGVLVDHRNRCRQDNTLRNLRIATHGQNESNKLSRSLIGYKGVSKVTSSKRDKCWRARLRVGEKTFCKYFYTPEDAAMAYNQMAIEHFGEFAVLNVIRPVN